MAKTTRKDEGEKMDLRNATEVDLRNELDRRAQERRNERNTKQDVRVASVRKASSQQKNEVDDDPPKVVKAFVCADCRRALFSDPSRPGGVSAPSTPRT